MSTTHRRSVLITGCSTGIGLQTALEAARRGWVVHAGVRAAAGAQVLTEAARVAGLTVHPVLLDVRQTASIGAAARTVLGTSGGRLDALVHNAAIGGSGFLEEMSDDEIEDVVATNLLGPVRLTRALLPALRSAVNPRLVVVTSAGVFWPVPAGSMYLATKGALEMWAETLAVELAPVGVAVSLVEPGTFRTSMHDKLSVTGTAGGVYEGLATRLGPRLDDAQRQFAGDPADVARAITDLLDAPRPALRTLVGRDAHVLRVMRRVVPFPLRRAMTLRRLGLPRRSSNLPASASVS